MPEICFNGPAGRIEGRYIKARYEKAPMALILPPSPIHGGTMNNKVVYKAYQVLADSGMHVLRINFRGVGRSQGEFNNGVGELTDAATALDWLQTRHQQSSYCWIVGFSFGAWIAMQLIMRRPEINNFVAIAPPVNQYDFSFLYPCPIPGLIVQGDLDSVVLEANVADIIDKFNRPKKTLVTYKVVEEADHFFRGKLDKMGRAIQLYIEGQHLPVSDTNFENKKNNKIFLQ